MDTLLKPLRRPLRRPLVVALVALLGVAACNDPFQIRAQNPNIDVNLELWAINGSPASYPSAVIVAQGVGVPLDAEGAFDIAFDITDDGRLLVYPMGRLVQPITGVRQIQLQRGTGSYSAIADAPRTGWLADTILGVNQGGTFLVKATTVFCQFDFRQEVYGKFFVDSVIPEERRIKLTARVNPNCGFRQLLPGVPEF